MRIKAKPVRALAVLLVSLATGLGLAVASPGPAMAADILPTPAMSVAVEDTGGFIGIDDKYLVTRPTVTLDSRTIELFRLVGSPQYRALARAYLPSSRCCDLIQTTVTVKYLDGSTKVVTTMTGGNPPAILTRVATLVRQIAGRPVALDH